MSRKSHEDTSNFSTDTNNNDRATSTSYFFNWSALLISFFALITQVTSTYNTLKQSDAAKQASQEAQQANNLAQQAKGEIELHARRLEGVEGDLLAYQQFLQQVKLEKDDFENRVLPTVQGIKNSAVNFEELQIATFKSKISNFNEQLSNTINRHLPAIVWQISAEGLGNNDVDYYTSRNAISCSNGQLTVAQERTGKTLAIPNPAESRVLTGDRKRKAIESFSQLKEHCLLLEHYQSSLELAKSNLDLLLKTN
jgi:hypothetical protein